MLARVRGTPFDLRKVVAAMGSPRAVDGGGGGWAGISLDVLRSMQVSFQADKAVAELWAASLALRRDVPGAIEGYAAAVRAVEATGMADRARHEALAELEAQPAEAARALWDATLALRRDVPGAIEGYAAAARAVTGAGESRAGAAHFGFRALEAQPAVAADSLWDASLKLRRDVPGAISAYAAAARAVTDAGESHAGAVSFGHAAWRKRTFDAAPPMPPPKRSKTSLAVLKTFEGVRTAWIQAEELCMDWLDGARRKWHCRLCRQEGFNDKKGKATQCSKATRHITRKHLAALEKQEEEYN